MVYRVDLVHTLLHVLSRNFKCSGWSSYFVLTTPSVYVVRCMSQNLNFLQLLRQAPCELYATAHNRQFLVAAVANRVSSGRKLYCESVLSGQISVLTIQDNRRVFDEIELI